MSHGNLPDSRHNGNLHTRLHARDMPGLPDHLKRTCAHPLCPNRFAARDVRHQYCSEKCAGKQASEFIAIDGEGTGKGKDHRYVLLGVGSEQREWPDGVRDITEVFAFLYDGYRENPDGIFCGFYLGYDFNMWLRLLPRERAAMLVSREGIAKRRRKTATGHHLAPWPVEYRDWEFDALGEKRFKLRPAGETAWMYVCDAGPFFQCSLLKAIDPKTWNDPVVTQEEYEIVKAGKERRDTAGLDDGMRYYNRLENDILSRLMTRYREGMAHAGVTLKKQQWFGPGQAAQKWMRVVGTLDKPTEAVRIRARKDEAWWDAVCSTYYGGWFELAVHGVIPGEVYGYDINSAYPYIASQLPCVCGNWTHGSGRPPRETDLTLIRCIGRGRSRYLGGLPYRSQDNHVLRPRYTNGWYWLDEVQAAKRAGLIDDVTFFEWYQYQDCGHGKPLKLLEDLYETRLSLGKNTPAGKGMKLIYNSAYGKLCQSQGEDAPFSNPVYASRITSGCRRMILDAIATHPDKAAAVAMIATDGVYFLSPHPRLELSEKTLGKWSTEVHENMTLFKPGVYWDDEARKAIADGKAPQFKARGISAVDFGESIATVDALFREWGANWLPGMGPAKRDWPTVEFHARFSQTSIKQAVQWTAEITDPAKQQAIYRNLAGVVKEDRKLKQDSWPGVKRNPQRVFFDGRTWRSEPWDGGPHWPASKPYDRNFGLTEDDGGFSEFVTPDAPVMLQFRSVINV